MLVTYREATARKDANTWEDVHTLVLAWVDAWRKSPARKEKGLWRKLTQLIPKPYLQSSR